MKTPWMKRSLTALVILGFVVVMCWGATVIVLNAVYDIPETAAPANPAAGFERYYADSTTHKFTCLTSAGASCLGGGGGLTAAPPYLTDGTHFFVAATGYQATLPNGGSFSYINGVTPSVTMAGTNGDYLYGGTGTTQYFQTQSCSTSIEAEFTAEINGAATGAAGIWVWDSTNSHLFVFEFVASTTIALQGEEFSYSGTGNPSPISAYFGPLGAFGAEPVQHYKMSVSGGTLSISYSLDGGGTYFTLNTQSGIGTLSACGTTVISPTVMDILSLATN